MKHKFLHKKYILNHVLQKDIVIVQLVYYICLICSETRQLQYDIMVTVIWLLYTLG